MDPTTTLFTFMLQTHPSVQSVHLIGSWDNFSKPYPMQRDSRRSRDQWRGCYTFKDIICDGHNSDITKRDGGLKMGETYYYYYEVDGANEMHDPSLPSTTACPFLPGQKVNTLTVPMEHALRQRSASLTSLRQGDYKTMNPEHKYVAPRPPPPVPSAGSLRPDTSPQKRDTTHSLSPQWDQQKRFGCKRGIPDNSVTQRPGHEEYRPTSSAGTCHSNASFTSTRSGFTAEGLHRFLSESPSNSLKPASTESNVPKVVIPDDIAEEEDDANFAGTSISETTSYTGLSPPPMQRNFSSTTILQIRSVTENKNDSQTTIEPSSYFEVPKRTPPEPPRPATSSTTDLHIPLSRFSLSSSSSRATSPMTSASLTSAQSPDPHSPPSIYHSESEEDDGVSSFEDDRSSLLPSLNCIADGGEDRQLAGGANQLSLGESVAAAFAGYRLPRTSIDEVVTAKAGNSDATSKISGASPAVIASDGSEPPVAGKNAGLDSLVDEMGWLAAVIHGNGTTTA